MNIKPYLLEYYTPAGAIKFAWMYATSGSEALQKAASMIPDYGDFITCVPQESSTKIQGLALGAAQPRVYGDVGGVFQKRQALAREAAAELLALHDDQVFICGKDDNQQVNRVLTKLRSALETPPDMIEVCNFEVQAESAPKVHSAFLGNLKKGDRFGKLLIVGNYKTEQNAQLSVRSIFNAAIESYTDGIYKRGWVVYTVMVEEGKGGR